MLALVRMRPEADGLPVILLIGLLFIYAYGAKQPEVIDVVLER
jgi:hypothetical protein